MRCDALRRNAMLNLRRFQKPHLKKNNRKIVCKLHPSQNEVESKLN